MPEIIEQIQNPSALLAPPKPVDGDAAVDKPRAAIDESSRRPGARLAHSDLERLRRPTPSTGSATNFFWFVKKKGVGRACGRCGAAKALQAAEGNRRPDVRGLYGGRAVVRSRASVHRLGWREQNVRALVRASDA
jgi:hypothetical protein